MLSIKTFKDGDRLVVVFEGLNDLPSEEEMVKNCIKSILAGSVPETLPEADVVPIVTEEEAPPVIRDEIFLTGPYEGKTPKEILESGSPKEKREAFIYLTNFAKSEVTEDELALLQDVKKVIREYVKRFQGDGESYAGNLTETQLNLFLYQFLNVLRDEQRDQILAECNISAETLFKAGEETKRRVVSRYVDEFREM